MNPFTSSHSKEADVILGEKAGQGNDGPVVRSDAQSNTWTRVRVYYYLANTYERPH